MGLFDKDKENTTEVENTEEMSNVTPMRIPFATWTVGDTDYRLRLDVSAIEELEMKFKTNLLNLLGDNGNMPAIKVMLDVVHKAAQKYQHNLKRDDVAKLYQKWIDEGHSQIEFYLQVFMGVYKASGFFSKSMNETIGKAQETGLEEL